MGARRLRAVAAVLPVAALGACTSILGLDGEFGTGSGDGSGEGGSSSASSSTSSTSSSTPSSSSGDGGDASTGLSAGAGGDKPLCTGTFVLVDQVDFPGASRLNASDAGGLRVTMLRGGALAAWQPQLLKPLPILGTKGAIEGVAVPAGDGEATVVSWPDGIEWIPKDFGETATLWSGEYNPPLLVAATDGQLYFALHADDRARFFETTSVQPEAAQEIDANEGCTAPAGLVSFAIRDAGGGTWKHFRLCGETLVITDEKDEKDIVPIGDDGGAPRELAVTLREPAATLLLRDERVEIAVGTDVVISEPSERPPSLPAIARSDDEVVAAWQVGSSDGAEVMIARCPLDGGAVGVCTCGRLDVFDGAPVRRPTLVAIAGTIHLAAEAGDLGVTGIVAED
jgi:hypothetical protein